MLTPFLTLTLGEEVDQSRNTVSSCVFHSVWPGDSERLFLSGVGEQQWLEWTEQSIAACSCRTGLKTHSLPAGAGVSLPYSLSSLFGSFFTPGGKWGHYDTLFPAGTHWRQVSMETKPGGTILKRQFVKQGVQILKEGSEKEFLMVWWKVDTHAQRKCAGKHIEFKQKQTEQQNTRMLLLGTGKQLWKP